MFQPFLALRAAIQIAGGDEWRSALMRHAVYPVHGRFLYWNSRLPAPGVRTGKVSYCHCRRSTMRRSTMRRTASLSKVRD